MAKFLIALPNHKEKEKQSRLKLQGKSLKTLKGCRKKPNVVLYQRFPPHPVCTKAERASIEQSSL